MNLTPSQTVGPFFSHALPWPDGPHVVAPGTPGSFWLRGRVLDGAGEPVPDALVESWQAGPDGRFAEAARPGVFRGFGRCGTDADGRWAILTVRPGSVPDQQDRPQAPHIDLAVFARGLLDRVVTRVYLPEEADANAADLVLASVEPARRDTLVAVRTGDGYHFDITLQGDRETVFFSV